MSAQGFPEATAARRAIIVLACLGFVATMDLTLTALLIEPMKQEMALTDIDIGLLQGSAFGLAFGIASIPMGRMIDRYSRVRLMTFGLVLWTFAIVGTGLARSFTVLVICRVFLGVVAALLIPAALSLIADLFPAQRRAVMTSVFAMGQATGQAFGILFGGIAFDWLTRQVASQPDALDGLAPWRVLYVSAGAIGALLLIFLLSLREPARQERASDSLSFKAAMQALSEHKSFLVPLLIATIGATVVFQAAHVWSAPLLIRNHGLSPGAFAGWLSAIVLGTGILGALAGGQLAELGRKRAGRAGVLVPALVAAFAIVPLTMYAIVSGVATLAVLLALVLLFSVIIATVSVVAITLNVPNEIRGLALGANVLATGMFGATLSPTLVGFVSSALGGETQLGTAVTAVSAPAALCAALFFYISMRSASSDAAPALSRV
ncbi:MFS transporter [Peristeroidobacter agariperforans]|uniref:MFS transporter n=1 Tax=Peristeroidobacter agariperforans TaxID=268404 RepID=UPI0013008306|nr:MFS transporter [Peristeroidobacter agariperforans]